MKKMIIMAVVLLSSMATYAQREVGSLTLQPKVGLNVADLTELKGDVRLGVAAGAELEYQVADIVSLSAGAIYSMQGNKYEYELLKQKAKVTHKIDYINVPIMANVYVAKGLAVKLGVQPGFKVSSKLNAETNTILGKTDNSLKTDPKSFDLSIPVGLSYEYSNVVLDARYNWGVTKVFENSDAKNSVFQITLGYKFAL